jgi:hypothetical protein
LKKKKTKIPDPSFGTIILAFLFKYSFLISLFFLYWAGFKQVNLINLACVILFLIFFANTATTYKIEKEQKERKSDKNQILPNISPVQN